MRVAFILIRMTMPTELDADAIGTKPVDQIGQRPFGRSGPPEASARRTCPLRQPVKICQCPRPPR